MTIDTGKIEEIYCDDCGDLLEVRAECDNPRIQCTEHKSWKPYSRLPWDVQSANKGESGVVCDECAERLNDPEGRGNG